MDCDAHTHVKMLYDHYRSTCVGMLQSQPKSASVGCGFYVHIHRVRICCTMKINTSYYSYAVCNIHALLIHASCPQRSCAVLFGRHCYRHSHPQPSYTTSVRQQPPLQPRTRLKLRKLSFAFAGPAAWNTLLSSIQELSDTESFKHHLKTVFFQQCYCCSTSF